MIGEFSERKYSKWHEFFSLMLIAVLENFGYRQLTVLFRVAGTFDALLKKKGWAKFERKKM